DRIAGACRTRLPGHHRGGDRIDARRWNPASGEQIANLSATAVGTRGERISDLKQLAGAVEGLGEIALALRICGDGVGVGEGRALAQALPIEKPENLILDDGAAGGQPVLIEAKDG